MGSLLALLSSLLWGTADYLAGNLSKRYRAIAVTGVSQFFGLVFGLSVIAIGTQFGSPFIAPTLQWDGYLFHKFKNHKQDQNIEPVYDFN